MAERTKAVPVEQDAPVEPVRTRRGRRKLDDVAAVAAKEAAKTTAEANRAKVRAKTRTALLSEQERQQEIIDRRKETEARKRRAKSAARWASAKERGAAGARTAMVVGPIVAPMAVAWTGQSGFATSVLKWPFAASLLYAAAYELTTVFSAYMYHEARKDGDKGWEYRIATWAFGIGAGVQQWWHYSDNWAATPRSVTYSTMTAVGIAVWELYARLIHRRKLRADGRLEEPRPRIGLARWLRYFPISWRAWSGSVRHGFKDFETMWIWAETEHERAKGRKDKVKELRAQVRELKAQLESKPITAESERLDLEPSGSIRPEIEAANAGSGPTSIPDLARSGPISVEIEALNPGSGPISGRIEPVNPGPGTVKVGPNGESFDGPTSAEIQAVAEMIEAGIRVNRDNIAAYVRENSDRLNQAGISTWRAARVAAWGRDNSDNLKSVS